MNDTLSIAIGAVKIAFLDNKVNNPGFIKNYYVANQNSQLSSNVKSLRIK